MCVCGGGGGAGRDIKCITTGFHFERGVTLVFDNSRRGKKIKCHLFFYSVPFGELSAWNWF